MPKSFDEAARQGARLGLRNFIANFFGHLGKGAAFFVLAVALIFVALWVAEWMWDGFTSPFRSVWSWAAGSVGGGVDWVASWFPGGDTVGDMGSVVATEEIVTDAPAEPGIICRNTSGWNWFCK